MLLPDDIRYLVVHCSDTPDDQALEAGDIHDMHLGFGWDGAGYHQIICRDGSCQPARPPYWQGAHVKGHNTQSLGVCLIGRHNFSVAQMAALERLLLSWKSLYPDARILGHCDFQDTLKTCPNFDAGTWWASRDVMQQGRAHIISACAGLYRQPPEHIGPPSLPSHLLTEGLYGESVRVIDRKPVRGYAQIELATDGYQGWISLEDIAVLTADDEPDRQVITPSIIATASGDVKSPAVFTLPFGAQIKCLKEEGEYTLISLYGRAGSNRKGYVPNSAIQPLIPPLIPLGIPNHIQSTGQLAGQASNQVSNEASKQPALDDICGDWVAMGEQFIGSPYKWGGRTYHGLDCSALVQLCLAMAGCLVPRDSGPQRQAMMRAHAPPDEAYKRYSRGDILFWSGHVGICVASDKLLHANAFHHRVAIEPISEAITRLQADIGAPIAHINGNKLISG